MSLHPKIFLRVPPTSIQNFMLVSLIAQFFHLQQDDRGNTEVGFDILELGVGMQRWGSTALNWVWACGGGVRQP